MTGAGPFTPHLAAAGNLYTFAQTFVSLLLAHDTQLFQYDLKRIIVRLPTVMSSFPPGKSAEKVKIGAKTSPAVPAIMVL
jgi:hypothetical protein